MFVFELECQGKSHLIVFSTDVYGDEHDYASFFEEVYRKNSQPDFVVFLAPKYVVDTLGFLYESDSPSYKNAKRYGDKVGFIVLGFDCLGRFHNVFNDCDYNISSGFDRTIIETGLTYLSKKNNVIEKAPPGTRFYKPSSRGSREFINASKLAVNSQEEGFVAFAILHAFNGLEDFDCIYLDTYSISGYVAFASKMLDCFGEKINVKWVSFKSYDGLYNINLNEFGRSLFIVSASSSNGMAKEIMSRLGVNKDNIVTLLSYVSDDEVIANISSLSSNDNGGSDNRVIEIKRLGENFSAEYLSPRAVVLKKKHGKLIDMPLFEKFHNRSVFKCNFYIRGDNDLPREVAFDTSDLNINDINDNGWLDKIVNLHIPSSLERIYVRKEDEFGIVIAQYLKDQSGLNNVDVCDFESVKEHDYDGSLGAVIILSSAISGGDGFIDMNRALRISKHDGMRLFISAFSLFVSSENKKIFCNSLVCGPDLEKYKFFCKHEVIANFRKDEHPWETEKVLISELSEENAYWKARHEILSNSSKGVNGYIGCCKKQNNKPGFSRHFAFWNFNYIDEEVSNEAVYFTIASILQYARENEALSKDDSLKGDIYQQALISPENFLRFNDHALISSIVRAAESYELDYSSSKKYSSDFVDYVSKILDRYCGESSEALLDIFIFLATRKIKIHQNSFMLLRKKIQDSKPLYENHMAILSDKVITILDS